MSDPYKIKIGGVVADPYRIAMEYDLDPIIAQAVKKLLRIGRKHKTAMQDADEAITTIQRWKEIQEEIAKEKRDTAILNSLSQSALYPSSMAHVPLFAEAELSDIPTTRRSSTKTASRQKRSTSSRSSR